MMFGIKTIITKHFEMLFRDVYNKPPDEVKSRYTFGLKLIIFMRSIVKGYRFSIVGIDAGSCYDRPSQITVNIFDSGIRRTGIRLSPDIKSIFMIVIDCIFSFLKRRTDDLCHTVKKDFAEGIAEEGIIKMFYITPWGKVAGTALRNQCMDMRVPFEVTSKGVKDTDKTGSEVF